MRRGRKAAAAGITVVTLLAGAGIYLAVSGTGGDARAAGDSGGEPPTVREAEESAAAFLTAWADGDTAGAAALSSDPGAAEAALAGFASDIGLTALELTPGAVDASAAGADGPAVPFTVLATLSHDGDETEWRYESRLSVVRGDDGDPVVDWHPQVTHPELDDGETLEVTTEAMPPVRALDRHGEPLDPDSHESLDWLLAALAEEYGAAAGGTAGAELRIRVAGEAGDGDDTDDGSGSEPAAGTNGSDGAAGSEPAALPLLELRPSVAGDVPTTIDPELQRAAEAALADSPTASLAAVEPSTGAVRALVTAAGDDNVRAVEGRNAPGSTWKIVSAGLLLEEGLAAPGAKHPCPKYFEHGGWEFQNLDEFDIKNGTFTDSFAASCNTAFISAAPELADDQLSQYARDAFGIGLDWQVGVATDSGEVPEEADAQMAAQLIGQAGVRANPLVMASVSATVRDGEFRQPHLVPADFDGRQFAVADGPSAQVSDALRALMRVTAASGTAAEAMSGVPGETGAKTGSAEVPEQDKPNAWFTAYRDDLAVAAIVPDAGHGGKFAGPLVAEVLKASGS